MSFFFGHPIDFFLQSDYFLLIRLLFSIRCFSILDFVVFTLPIRSSAILTTFPGVVVLPVLLDDPDSFQNVGDVINPPLGDSQMLGCSVEVQHPVGRIFDQFDKLLCQQLKGVIMATCCGLGYLGRLLGTPSRRRAATGYRLLLPIHLLCLSGGFVLPTLALHFYYRLDILFPNAFLDIRPCAVTFLGGLSWSFHPDLSLQLHPQMRCR
mmetsp:Transcript_15130/g.30730  ORF Transcript_15130/g.30730 Transcript_15130/m.30730 type:complete len:209 (-) Transcript_15130:323-949(-)